MNSIMENISTINGVSLDALKDNPTGYPDELSILTGCLYDGGSSVPELAEQLGLLPSTVHHAINIAGMLVATDEAFRENYLTFKKHRV